MNVAAVAELLRARLGLDPPSLGADVLPGVVAGRMRALGLADARQYAEHLAGSNSEFAALVEEVVVPETWFFRGGEVFAFLAGHVRRSTGPFRALSAPCSSGEEPYSLVLALAEAGVDPGRWTVEGVDVSARSLGRALRGVYTELAFRETPAGLRRKYFRPADGGWELEPALRRRVRFRQGNLLDPGLFAGGRPFDLIFCRNVLIYLHAEARRRVLAHLDRWLAPDGLLCAGHAEPLSLLDRRFEPTGPDGGFVFRRKPPSGERSRVSAPSAPRQPLGALTQPRSPLGALTQPRSPLGAPVDLLAQARAQADAGALHEAMQSCRAHLAAAAPTADAYSLLGVIHQARKERGPAVDCFRKALYLDPANEEALLHLMLLYEEAGDGAAAARLRRRLGRRTAGGEA